MQTSTLGQAIYYGDIFQLPEGVEDFLLDTYDDPVLDSEDLGKDYSTEANEVRLIHASGVVSYDTLMHVQDFYVAEGMDMEECLDDTYAP